MLALNASVRVTFVSILNPLSVDEVLKLINSIPGKSSRIDCIYQHQSSNRMCAIDRSFGHVVIFPGWCFPDSAHVTRDT